MPDALLMLHVHIEVADEHDGTVRANTLLASGELTALHVPLHDVHAVLGIEGHARHFIKTHHVVLTHQTAGTVLVVHEHLGHSGLAAGNKVRIGGHLLEQVRLAGTTRPQLHQVVVTLDERHHAQQHGIFGALRQSLRLKANAA